MSNGDESAAERPQEWRPDQAGRYAAGPVLTERQAETIAALDGTQSRQGTAALLDISASTVDDHRQDGQQRVIAAIRQLRTLCAHSETLRAAVTDEFGAGAIQVGSTDEPTDATVPNQSTDALIEDATAPELPEALTITPSRQRHQRADRRRWAAAFVDAFGEAERVAVVDEPTGERLDVGELDLRAFPLDAETIPVGNLRDAALLDRFLSTLWRALSAVDHPVAFRRLD
jgi:DNA-binding CsgD family transcriptional regulator